MSLYENGGRWAPVANGTTVIAPTIRTENACAGRVVGRNGGTEPGTANRSVRCPVFGFLRRAAATPTCMPLEVVFESNDVMRKLTGVEKVKSGNQFLQCHGRLNGDDQVLAKIPFDAVRYIVHEDAHVTNV